MTTATDERAELETRERELAEEVERLEGRRGEIADELDEAETAVAAAREAHRSEEASADDLADAQSRASALRGTLEEIDGDLEDVRANLQNVRQRLRDRDELDEFAKRAREAQRLWEDWDEKRRELADAVSRLAEEIVDRELRLAEIAKAVQGEEELARRLRESGRDESLAALGGYREPDENLRRLWRGRNGMEVRVPFVDGGAERSDLGRVDDVVESIIERERDRREH